MKRKDVNIVDVLRVGNRFYSAENVEELIDRDQRKTNALRIVFKYFDVDLSIYLKEDCKPLGIVDLDFIETGMGVTHD